MRSAIAVAALAGLAYAAPQSEVKAPSSQPAASCQKTVPGSFQIQVVNVTRKRDVLEARQDGALRITLNNGILKDQDNRQGEIVANHQFQFDPILQPDAIYTSGFAVCSNGSLVLGNQAVFYQCLSGNFYNLYDQSQGGQCSPIYIQTIGGGAMQSGTASQAADGQVTATPGASSRPVSQVSDGQVQATTSAAAVSQISDGQVQATTKATMVPMQPVQQISDGQLQVMSTVMMMPVTQIGDGQIQAPTGKPVSQISDGQVQAPTSKPAMTTGKPVSQIGDGQIQAATSKPVMSSSRPVSQIGDGQIQAPTRASNGTSAMPSVQAYTGAASSVRGSVFGLAAGVLAVAML